MIVINNYLFFTVIAFEIGLLTKRGIEPLNNPRNPSSYLYFLKRNLSS